MKKWHDQKILPKELETGQMVLYFNSRSNHVGQDLLEFYKSNHMVQLKM